MAEQFLGDFCWIVRYRIRCQIDVDQIAAVRTALCLDMVEKSHQGLTLPFVLNASQVIGMWSWNTASIFSATISISCCG